MVEGNSEDQVMTIELATKQHQYIGGREQQHAKISQRL